MQTLYREASEDRQHKQEGFSFPIISHQCRSLSLNALNVSALSTQKRSHWYAFFCVCMSPTVTYPQDLITADEKKANYPCACLNELITFLLGLPLFSLDVR